MSTASFFKLSPFYILFLCLFAFYMMKQNISSQKKPFPETVTQIHAVNCTILVILGDLSKGEAIVHRALF